MKKLILSQIFLIASLGTFSQQGILMLDDEQACPGSEQLIRVYAGNIVTAGALSLFFNYDTLCLDYLSLENIHPQLSSLLVNTMNTNNKQLGICWHNKEGIALTGAKLFDIRFHYHSGSSEITFAEGCEIAAPDLEILPLEFIDGSVIPLVGIVENPENCNVDEWQDAVFQLSGTPDASYLWQQSSNGGEDFEPLAEGPVFQGVNSPLLTIKTCSLSQDGFLYRCQLEKQGCQVASEAATLMVNPIVHSQELLLETGWNSLSTWLLPPSTQWEDLFSGILARLVLVWDGTGIFYPAGNLNSIGSFDPSRGYLVKTNPEVSFTISGYTNTEKNLNIPEGWSLIPILSPGALEISVLFGDHLYKLEIIKDPTGTKIFWPSKGIYTLDTLNPGKSYFIKANTAFELVFP